MAKLFIIYCYYFYLLDFELPLHPPHFLELHHNDLFSNLRRMLAGKQLSVLKI